MTTLFRGLGRPAAVRTAAALTLGLAAVALVFSSPARAATSACNDPVTSVPTGPATVSAASTAFGRVLVVGSGADAGCSLYLLTSDQLHSLTGANFACGNTSLLGGTPCDTVLWPALLTDGAPIAGPGVNPTLLGTVTRTDLPKLPSVQQVTYAGLPLYRFHFDDFPGDTQGANVFDPVTSPTGIWYLVNASRGGPAPGQAQLRLETAPASGLGPQTVLAATMDNAFTDVFGPPPPATFVPPTFPAYTLSSDSRHQSACQGLCAFDWPPVLTWKRPQAGPGVDQHALGIIVRPDGTHQVTYDRKPLYLFSGDAYLLNKFGTPGINGAGAPGPLDGIFNTIPSLP
jgi:predicted lipoprotein with Yx(FWY)xxD motif